MRSVLLVLAALAHFVVAVVRHVGVVLVLVDRMAQIVLLVVDLLPLLLRQPAIIGRAIVADLAVQVGFARLHISGLARSQLAGNDAVGDAILLVLTALVDRRIGLVGLGLRGGLALLSKGRSRGDQGGHGKRNQIALHVVPPRALILELPAHASS
jgi:hypothetical protein